MLCVFVFLTALRNPKDLHVFTKVICEYVNIKQSCELSQPDCQCLLCWPAWSSALLPTGPTADRTASASFWEGGPPAALRGLPARTTASVRIEHESGRKGTGACAEITIPENTNKRLGFPASLSSIPNTHRKRSRTAYTDLQQKCDQVTYCKRAPILIDSSSSLHLKNIMLPAHRQLATLPALTPH